MIPDTRTESGLEIALKSCCFKDGHHLVTEVLSELDQYEEWHFKDFDIGIACSTYAVAFMLTSGGGYGTVILSLKRHGPLLCTHAVCIRTFATCACSGLTFQVDGLLLDLELTLMDDMFSVDQFRDRAAIEFDKLKVA